jgi:Ca-activated chloride channel family protein
VLALFALALGVARPQAERSVPRDKATVMLAIDVSGSMSAEDVSPTRLEAAQKAALQFADEMPRTFQVGLVAFSGSASVIVPPTTDREQLRNGIRQLVPDGDTAIGDALLTSLRAISDSQGGVAVPDSARILLLSDGTNRTGTSLEEALPQIQAAKVPVYTVALGTPDGTLFNGQPVPPSPETMRSVAESTGGQSFTAEDASSVNDVYRNLGRFIGTVREQHDVTDWFVAAAMALLVASAAAWWRWDEERTGADRLGGPGVAVGPAGRARGGRRPVPGRAAPLGRGVALRRPGADGSPLGRSAAPRPGRRRRARGARARGGHAGHGASHQAREREAVARHGDAGHRRVGLHEEDRPAAHAPGRGAGRRPPVHRVGAQGRPHRPGRHGRIR